MNRRILSPDTPADMELRQVLGAKSYGGFTMIAGAGSGKTTSLVKALDHITRSSGDRFRSNAQKVACITYTEVAANEIASEVDASDLVHVSTIHSFLWSIVKPFQSDIAGWLEGFISNKIENLKDEQSGFSSRISEQRRVRTAEKIEQFEQILPRVRGIGKFIYSIGSDYGRGLLGHEDITTLVPHLILSNPLLVRLVARQYPIVFVDESQDTLPAVVNCLRHISRKQGSKFCVGFFGDPMQKIYVRGIGEIELEENWTKISKPENFRSPNRVLDVINWIRADADGLHQVSGLPDLEQKAGQVKFFVLPTDNDRTNSLEAVLRWLRQQGIAGGTNESSHHSSFKILVIAHRMAARRLGFADLHEAFHSNPTLRDAFDEGRAWPLAPFLSVLLPICDEVDASGGNLVGLLRKVSPILRDENLTAQTARTRLKDLAKGVDALHSIVKKGGIGSVGQAMSTAANHQLLDVDDRFRSVLELDEVSSESDEDDLAATVRRFFACDISEIQKYRQYLEQESPFSTHQGVKGAEYPHVVVVLDDEEGRHNQFSYDKLLQIKPLSGVDLERQSRGEDFILTRTRRLFYVCASRATESLSIVLFAKDVRQAVSVIKESGMPGAEDVAILADIRGQHAVPDDPAQLEFELFSPAENSE